MKGLLLKDAYVIRKQYRISLMLVLGFIVFSVFTATENAFMTVYPCIFAGLIPVGLLSFDESSKWNVYCGALPYTRDQLVAEKYLLSAGLAVVISGLCTAASAVGMAIRGAFAVTAMLSTLCTCVLSSCLSAAVSMPFVFKFGVEKGRIAYCIAVGAVCAGSVILANVTNIGALSGVIVSPQLLAVFMLAAAVVLFAASWYASVLFYRKREL